MNQTWYLLSLILNASNGEPLEIKSLGSFDSPEACVEAREGQIHSVRDNRATVLICAREAPKDERSI